MQKFKLDIILIFLMSLLMSGSAFSANEMFRSRAFGNWNATSTWLVSTNGGASWTPASSTPTNLSGTISIFHVVTVTADVTADQINIQSGATLAIDSGITLTYPGNAGTFTLSNATVSGAGTFKVLGPMTMDLKSTATFSAGLRIASGSVVATDLSPPRIGKLLGPVSVDPGAILGSCLAFNESDYSLEFYGNLTNNGIITSTAAGSNKRHAFKGSALINNGIINPSIFNLESVSNVSGTGTFSPVNYMSVGANGNVTLQSDITFSPANYFYVLTGGILNPNNYSLNFTSGILEVQSSGTIVNSGMVWTQNTVMLNLRAGSAFNAPLRVTNGSIVSATDLTTPYLGKLFGDVTVDEGGTLGSYHTFHNTSFGLEIYGNVTNNGTITANSAGNKSLSFYGSNFINNGLVSHPHFSFRSIAALSGTGSFTSNATVLSGAAVTLISDHKLASLNINAGGSFNMDNRIVGFTSSDPIIQNGTFSNAVSMIEYIGTAFQTISTSNIVYHKLRINNANGTSLAGNVAVEDTLSLILGDLDMNTRILTLSATGYLAETPGNTLTGGSGYVTTTRNVGIPDSINVGGLGAVLTAATDLGITEIRRGHTTQTGGSIRRFYDIFPANNSRLNATLRFLYDESELGLRPESILKLKKSTDSGASYSLIGGSANPLLNEITLSGISSFSRWTADSSGTSAVIGMAIQGFYNSETNRLRMLDTVRTYFRDPSPPYSVIDSGISILDSVTLKASFVLPSLASGTYFIQLKHRNSIETWSSSRVTYASGSTLVYDFASAAAQAFGSNMIEVGASRLRFAIYGGDVNRDGTVDATDVALIDNDAQNFVSGYVVTDLTGDNFVDGTDFAIADNNAANFVSAITP